MCFVLIAINTEGDGEPKLVCKKDTKEECETEQSRIKQNIKDYEEKEREFRKYINTFEPKIDDYMDKSLSVWEKAKADFATRKSIEYGEFLNRANEPVYNDYYDFYIL